MKQIEFFFKMASRGVITRQRLFNLARHKLSARKFPSQVANPPFVATIETTNVCPLQCPTCPTGSRTMRRNKGRMSMERFQAIVDLIAPFTFRLNLCKDGEPFLYNDFCDMVSYAKSRRMYVTTSTSGMFLETPEKIDSLLSSGLDELIFSVDGANAETYDKFRIGGDFDQVTETIRDVMEIKRAKRVRAPEVILQCIITRWTENELDQVRTLGNSLGVDRVFLKTLFLNQEIGMEVGQKFLPHREKLSRYTFSSSDPKSKRKPQKCRALWEDLTINWDGSVAPCCYDAHGDYILGRLPEDGLWGVINSEATREFRTRLTEGPLNRICENCAFAHR